MYRQVCTDNFEQTSIYRHMFRQVCAQVFLRKCIENYV